MAEPNDAAIYLEDALDLVQEKYFDKYEEQYHSRFGRTTNKWFMPEPEVVNGDGKTMQYELGPADSVRFQTDPLGNIAAPQNLDAGKLKVRWNRQSPSAHDFTQVTARCQFDIYTIEDGGAGTIVNLADRIYDSVQKDFDEKLAIMRHIGRSAQLGLVNGTPRQADRESWTDSAASPTNSTGMTIKIDTGSIVVLRPNARYDFINPSTGAVRAGNIRCTDIPNFTESSARFEYVSTGPSGGLSTGDLSTVADNDIIVFSGTYNQGMYSFGAYFSTPTEGETFIGGADRTDTGYGWMLPQRINAASAKISKSFFNQAAIAMGYFGDNEQIEVGAVCHPTQHQALRDEIGEAAFVTYPSDDSRSKRFANFGSIGLNYQHGSFGHMKILSDALVNPSHLQFIKNGSWKTLSYGWKGLKALRESGGHWYRMNQTTPNTGRGLIMAADWAGNICDWGTTPWQNCVVYGLAEPVI